MEEESVAAIVAIPSIILLISIITLIIFLIFWSMNPQPYPDVDVEFYENMTARCIAELRMPELCYNLMR